MSKLKNCPFCGSNAELVNSRQAFEKVMYAIACSSSIIKECYLYSGSDERHLHDPRAWDDVLFWYVKKEDAVEAWNRRT